jgi:hypothetical protein
VSAGVAWPAKPALALFIWCAVYVHYTTIATSKRLRFALILASYRDIDKGLERHFCSTIAPLCRQVPTYRDTQCRDTGSKQIATVQAAAVAIAHET